jgi:hypothetical protein
MTNIIIAFDDKDENLGDYFSTCQSDISGFFSDHYQIIKKSPLLVPNEKCNQAYIDIEIARINPAPFVFIAYSHGNEHSLRCNKNSYVRKGSNTKQFTNSLFYTNSCLSGKELGIELVNNGCFAFIGYEEESNAFLNEEYYTISVNCDNSGLKTFFTDNIPVSIAFERMKSYYTNNIDKYESIDPFFAAQLVKNREALVLHKNKDIVKEDLFCK